MEIRHIIFFSLLVLNARSIHCCRHQSGYAERHTQTRLLILNMIFLKKNAYSPYSEVMSGGTLRGIALAFSHKALSLEQVHKLGHVFPGLLPSVSNSTDKRHRKEEILLKGLQAFPIL